MRTKLKQIRVEAGLTQASVARAANVSLPVYQRLEAGGAPLSNRKLRRLAKVLDTSPEIILDRHPPIEACSYDDTVDENLNYYGEVAIHFAGGGRPLLLSISEGAFRRLFAQLERSVAFATVESLANQTVVVRTTAIADLYFSNEAYDDVGPDGRSFSDYPQHLSIQMPDPRDWEIVEALACDLGVDDFDKADVQRVTERIMITNEQYDQLVSDGRIKPEDLASEREKNQKGTDMIFAAAHSATYQLSSGEQRHVPIYAAETLYSAFYELIDFDGASWADEMIVFPAEGWDRSLFISKNALDYVTIPTHRYLQGRTEFYAKHLDTVEATTRSDRKKVGLATAGDRRTISLRGDSLRPSSPSRVPQRDG